MHKSGTSLFELILCIALFALILSLSAHFMRGTDHLLVERELDRLYAAILFLQRKAIIEHKPCHLTFDMRHRQYYTDTSSTLSLGIMFGVPHGVLGPPSRPIHLIEEPITWPQRTLTCYPDGTISAGTLYITNAKQTYLYALTCDASQVSHIRRYRYDGRWILLK